jgi:hypothetical protein
MTEPTAADLYSTQINPLTLAECLDIHYRINPQFTRWDHYASPLARQIIRTHDATHVIFGCDTSLLGELQVESWSLFGVKRNWRDAPKYLQDPESSKLLNPIGYGSLAKFVLTHLHEVFRVWQRSRALSKRWVYFDEERYMQTPIGVIRAEYNIVLANAHADRAL